MEGDGCGRTLLIYDGMQMDILRIFWERFDRTGQDPLVAHIEPHSASYHAQRGQIEYWSL